MIIKIIFATLLIRLKKKYNKVINFNDTSNDKNLKSINESERQIKETIIDVNLPNQNAEID